MQYVLIIIKCLSAAKELVKLAAAAAPYLIQAYKLIVQIIEAWKKRGVKPSEYDKKVARDLVVEELVKSGAPEGVARVVTEVAVRKAKKKMRKKIRRYGGELAPETD